MSCCAGWAFWSRSQVSGCSARTPGTAPGHLPYLFARYESGELAILPLNLDTVVLEPESRTLALVWRLALPLEPPLRVLEARIVLREHKEEWLRRGGPVLVPPTAATANGQAQPDRMG